MNPLRPARAQDASEHLVPVRTDSRMSLWLNNSQGKDDHERRVVVEAHNGQGRDTGHGRKPCPPHGPYVVDDDRDGTYVAHCLACGLEGPQG